MKKVFFICGSLVLFGVVAGLMATRIARQNKEVSTLSESIHRDLIRETDKLSEEALEIIEVLKNGSSLPIETHHPFFLLKDNSIVSWTDHHIATTIPRAIVDDQYRFIRTPAGDYVFKRWKVDDERELIGALPLYVHFKISNQYLIPRYNRAVFGNQTPEILEASDPGGTPIKLEGLELFRIASDATTTQILPGTAKLIGGLSFLVAVISLFVLLILSMNELAKRYPQLAFMGLGIGFYLIRLGMIRTGFPTDYSDLLIFDPKNFASSEFNPSMGDLLINAICILVLCVFLLRNFAHFSLMKLALNKPIPGFITFAVSAIVLFFGMLFPYVVVQTIYNNSQISLSITRELPFDLLRSTTIAALMIACVASFIFIHVFVRILTQSKNWLRFIISIVTGIVVFSLINEFTGQYYYSTLVLTLVFLFVVLTLKLNKALLGFKYNTFIYFVTAILVFAVNCTFAVEQHELSKQVQHQSRFASNVLIDRDYFGEFLLRETLDQVKEDAFISARMANPLLGKDAIRQKIKQYHLPGYFNKYNVSVQLFTSSGSSLEDLTTGDFATLMNHFGSDANKTEYQGVFYVGNLLDNVTKQYIAYTPIYRGALLIGYIVLDLSLKKVIPENVYPELLVDTRFQQVAPPPRFSYAVFLNGTVQLSSGDYNYDLFDKELFTKSQLYSTGIIAKNFIHTATEDSGGKVAVVSTPVQPVFYQIADLSFFVILGLAVVFLLLVVVGIFTLYHQRSLFLSARIQLIINLAFFVPLISVSIVTLGLTAKASQEQISNDYLAKAKSFAGQISNALGDQAKTELEPSFNELTRLAGLDANIFSPGGKLRITSQPEIFENQLLGGLMNPTALRRIRKGDKTFVYEENVGKLNYFVAYAAVYSAGSGALSGVVALPFFQSASSLEHMQISVLANILIIFMILFIVLLIISAFVSRWLTYPLTMITQKLGKISLVNVNQPLIWDSNDEIGIMVREYNQMLEKLSESKSELERRQREQAWREIAQQVAHEIKNPLTPMKLTLQQLERLLGANKEEKIERSLSSLLTQVDTLDGIASSFSSFAKMPEPVLSNVELVRLTENIVELHQDSGARFESEVKEAMVIADKQLIGRIFSNIILNGIQSSQERKVDMRVSLVKMKGKYRVIFSDQGDGIEPELREKIFLPHFTTKHTGSGLGLAIAKQGIEQMGGEIWFETELGKGTTFYVELPEADPMN